MIKTEIEVTGAQTPQKVELAGAVLRWDYSGDNASENQETSKSKNPISIHVQNQSEIGLQFPPGLEPAHGNPSNGSALHMSGKCRPCPWFWRPQGCQNGQNCEHCHLCPEGEIKARKKVKQIIMRLGLATPKVTAGQQQKTVTSMERTPKQQDIVTCFPTTAERESATSTCSDQESTSGPGSESGVAFSSEPAASSEQDETPEPLTPPTQNFPNPFLPPPPGLEPTLGMPNQGSALHNSGNCHPCAWFWKSVGCQNGQNCAHCHICPVGALKARKKYKQAMMRVGLVTPKSDPAHDNQTKYAISLASLI